MAKVRFLLESGPIEADVPAGTSILEAAKKSGAPEGDRCGGVCACSTCHVYVRKGMDALTEPEDEELDILEKAFDPRPSSRLGCQAKIESDDAELEVEITTESFQAFIDEHPEQKERALALRKKSG
jgi:2Fe-2S ferredoxin